MLKLLRAETTNIYVIMDNNNILGVIKIERESENDFLELLPKQTFDSNLVLELIEQERLKLYPTKRLTFTLTVSLIIHFLDKKHRTFTSIAEIQALYRFILKKIYNCELSFKYESYIYTHEDHIKEIISYNQDLFEFRDNMVIINNNYHLSELVDNNPVDNSLLNVIEDFV